MKEYRLDVRKNSFSLRTIIEWNKLSTECVLACSVYYTFEIRIDKYLVRAVCMQSSTHALSIFQ